MNRARRPPLQHPLAHRFERAVTSLGAALHPDTLRHYRGTVRYFPTYLGSQHPKVRRLDQLSRDPHILGWLAQLRSQKPPLAIGSFINLLIHLRGVFTELAWTQLQPHLDHLLRPEDVPRLPHRLPRPLTAQQDQQLEQESLRRNDWGGKYLSPHPSYRHADRRMRRFACDCLHAIGPHQRAIQIPLGKLKTERMVPVDSFVSGITQPIMASLKSPLRT